MPDVAYCDTAIEVMDQLSTLHSSAARHRWAVILAGGDGNRLRPLTELACGDDRPKQFCPLFHGKTLLDQTRERIARAVHADRTVFVLTRKHEPFYQAALDSLPEVQKIVQPHNKGTLPAILWSLLRLFRTDPRALVAFFPSDHYFANEDRFLATIERAWDFVNEEREAVVLLGAGAERPETEYGWIEPICPPGNAPLRTFVPVRRFWEKPPLEIAEELLRQRNLWNTFVMIGSVGAFLEMIQQAVPGLFQTFSAVLLNSVSGLQEQNMKRIYDNLDPTDFSSEVLTRSTERLLVASCGEVGWSDLGEPRRFIAALAEFGAESRRATIDSCVKCGLTMEQMITLSGRERAEVCRSESVPLSSC